MEQNTVQKPDCAAITAQARQAAEELLAAAHLRAGDIFVVGCSSSEIVGGHIGKDSSMEAAAAVLAGVLPVLKAQGVYLAAQCCEHLNRAIVIEQEAAEKYGYEQVNAVPQPHAGGSWATNCWQAFEHPVLVEEVRAAAGLKARGRAGAPDHQADRRCTHHLRPHPPQIHRRQPRRLPGDVNHADTGTTDNDGRKCGPHP